MSTSTSTPISTTTTTITIATPTLAVERTHFKQFWSKFALRCDNKTMMLNASADEFEEEERHYILSSLPDLYGKDVLDVGAGIGRFTTMFAHNARHVLSTDFIESFVIKNKERNSTFNNITYQVTDAVHLQLEPNSVDMVFTNWLLMYLRDDEVIHFLQNVLHWLRPNGYVHIRESCSQPSTARLNGTMHTTNESNPTSYRFSSQYIQLFKTIRYRQLDGTICRFNIHWARSVPTYILRQKNWRQIHWLMQKIICDEQSIIIPSDEELLTNLNITSKMEQLKWDNILNEEHYCWTDELLIYPLINQCIRQNSTILSYNPRQLAYHLHINVHMIAEILHSDVVWNIECNEFFYRTSLTKANNIKDDRVRFAWNKNIEMALNCWNELEILFDAFIACELFANINSECIHKLINILRPGASILLLEPFNESDLDIESIKMMLSPFKEITVDDVTVLCNEAMSKYFHQRQLKNESPQRIWKLIRGRL